MFSRSFGRRKSLVVNRSVWVESLEGRRLLSASSIDADVLGLDAPSKTQDSMPTNFVTESVQLVKIEGTYVGHFISKEIGKNTLTFVITHDTHTGHFVGSVTINTGTSVGTLTADAKGVIKTSKHVSVSISSSKFSGIFTGTASHTGGSFFGSYSLSGSGISDSGTYHVGKA